MPIVPIILLIVVAIISIIKIIPLIPHFGNPLLQAIEPPVKDKISELKNTYGLDDLSYRIDITEQKYDTLAKGEIVFISDDIADLEPKDQYDLMTKVGTDFFSDLGTSLRYDGYTFIVGHGEGYSVWCTRRGDRYVASYYDLEKNGKEIYDNPDNDLEQNLADEMGMTVEELRDWLNSNNKDSSEPTKEYTSVDPDDDDFAAAVTAAKIVVKDQLKAPSTAKFPWDFDSYTVMRYGRDFTVTGYVDSQNGFGAMIRSEWVASFTLGAEINGKQDITNYSVLFS